MAHKNFQFLWRAHFVEGSLRGGLMLRMETWLLLVTY